MDKDFSSVIDSVLEAFAGFDREHFIKAMGGGKALKNDAVITKTNDEGVAISSSTPRRTMFQMLLALGAKPSQSILEIGTGTGYNTVLLASIVGPNGRVLSLEVDKWVSRRAKESIRKLGLKNIEVQTCNLYKWERVDEEFDGLIATCDLPLLPDVFLKSIKNQAKVVFPASFIYLLNKNGQRFEGYAICEASFMSARSAHAGGHLWQQIKKDKSPIEQKMLVYVHDDSCIDGALRVFSKEYTVRLLPMLINLEDTDAFHHFLWLARPTNYMKIQNLFIEGYGLCKGFGLLSKDLKSAVLLARGGGVKENRIIVSFGTSMGIEVLEGLHAKWRDLGSPGLKDQPVKLNKKPEAPVWSIAPARENAFKSWNF